MHIYYFTMEELIKDKMVQVNSQIIIDHKTLSFYKLVKKLIQILVCSWNREHIGSLAK